MPEYVVIGFSPVFKTKTGVVGRMVSLGFERKGYVGYKVIETFCEESLIKGTLSEGAIVNVFFGYKSTFCDGIRVC